MSYEIVLRSDSPDWWRYNVYLTLVGYDASGRQEQYASRVERTCGVWDADERSGPPPGWMAGQAVGVSCEASDRAAAWIYAIANTLPDAGEVTAAPDFEVTLTVRRDGMEILRRVYSVNPWGGLSVVGLEL